MRYHNIIMIDQIRVQFTRKLQELITKQNNKIKYIHPQDNQNVYIIFYMKQFIYQNLQPLRFTSGIAILYSIHLLHKTYREYISNKKNSQKLKQVPVIDLSQYVIANKNQNQKVFVRIKLAQQQSYISQKQIPYYSNNKYFIPPDLRNSNLEQVQRLSSKSIKININDASDNSVKKIMHGMGKITGQIFKTEVKKKEFQISLWKKFLAGFAFLGQLLISGYSGKKIAISGPKIGNLQIKTSLLPNQYLVVLLSFNESQLTPEYTGLSKTQIIQYIKDNNTLQYFIYSGIFFIFAYYSFKWFNRQLKKKKLLKPHTGYQMLNFIEEDFGKSCVICNENCRNVIFDDCMHLLLCKQCQSVYDKQICPVCRKPIKNRINVYEIKGN